MKTFIRYAAFLLLGGVASHAQTPGDIVKWTASIPRTSGSVASVPASVTARIANGWHLYAPTQAPGGPTAMTFRIPYGQPFTIGGAPKSSPPMKRRDENFQMETESYEGVARFTLPIKRTGETGSGIPIDVRFQVCNATLCLPPSTVHLTASAAGK